MEYLQKKLRIRDILELKNIGQEILCHGWLRTRRESKNLIFFELNDGSCMKNLQVIFDKDSVQEPGQITRLHLGSSVEAKGTLVASPGQGQNVELQAQEICLIGDADPESYPMQKKRHSFEYLREIAHLRPRTNTFGAIARVRNNLAKSVHQFFQDNGFLWLHSPIITASDAEGAGEMFQVTTLKLDRLAQSARDEVSRNVNYEEDFFGKAAFLTVSGQLSAEIYATAMERVYTFGPTFRAENSNTSRHLAEFWMIEPEIAFCDINCNMDWAEQFLKYCINSLLTESLTDMEFFDLRIQKGLIDQLQTLKESQFIRMTYSEAINILQDYKNFEFPVFWGCDLQSEHEHFLCENYAKAPVIIINYPKDIKAFYMRLNDDEKTVAGMDILVPRLGEIIGGSQREERLDILEKRITECKLKHKDYWWYLDLRRFGTVPHSGFGLGFDRLLQYITGMQNIRDVIPFPRTPKSINF